MNPARFCLLSLAGIMHHHAVDHLLDALGIPPAIGEHPELATTLSVVHKFTAYILVGVLALHVGATAHHALILRDGVFSRMWPPWAGRNDGPGSDAG